MKIILYTRRNVGLYALSFLKAAGINVLVISDDENVLWLANLLGVKIIPLVTVGNKLTIPRYLNYDAFICVHGNKIIPKEHLVDGRMYNIHPCLERYPGHDPIAKYIKNMDTEGSLSVLRLTEQVDKGEVLFTLNFHTGLCINYSDFYNIAVPYYFEALARLIEHIRK